MKTKHFNLLSLLCFLFFFVNAQDNVPQLKTNKKNIEIKYNAKKIQWSVSPEIDLDAFDIFELKAKKTTQVQFISDIDSVSFNVKLNKPLFLNTGAAKWQYTYR